MSDTPVALQQRIDAANASQANYAPSDSVGPVFISEEPAVTLSGDYTLTETINIYHRTRLHFDGATLDCRGLPSGAPAFAGSGWQLEVSGRGSLIGAPIGFKLDTGSLTSNLNTGMTEIKGIKFSECGLPLSIENRSSIVSLNFCSFLGGSRIVSSTMCDQLSFVDCTTQLDSLDDDLAPFEVQHGKLTIERGIYTPPFAASQFLDAAWVRLSGNSFERMVVIKGARFGSEHGGMALVRNADPKHNACPGGLGSVIVISGNMGANSPSAAESQAGWNKGPLVIADHAPNYLVIRDNFGPVKGPLVVGPGNTDADLTGCVTEIQQHPSLAC